MRKILLACLVIGLFPFPACADDGQAVIYWDSAQGQLLRKRIAAEADYWQLAPNFAMQQTQSYCGVASAVTVLNSLPLKKPVDPAYTPYHYFTQNNFFSPEVRQVIPAETALAQGMTREEMAAALARHGAATRSIPGDTFTDDSLRTLLRTALANDGQFVLANYFRASLDQVGGGHWSVLAAFDPVSDRVLILDVAKYKYSPSWVSIHLLRLAIATLDTTSSKPRGLVLVAMPPSAP